VNRAQDTRIVKQAGAAATMNSKKKIFQMSRMVSRERERERERERRRRRRRSTNVIACTTENV
jgi:hypothetical protein